MNRNFTRQHLCKALHSYRSPNMPNCYYQQGVLRINQKSYEEAFVDDPVT